MTTFTASPLPLLLLHLHPYRENALLREHKFLQNFTAIWPATNRKQSRWLAGWLAGASRRLLLLLLLMSITSRARTNKAARRVQLVLRRQIAVADNKNKQFYWRPIDTVELAEGD